jgi:hypothetical protein
MGEISQFIAMPFDLTEDGLVAGESFKCASPASAIERAKGYWQVLGHSGADQREFWLRDPELSKPAPGRLFPPPV